MRIAEVAPLYESVPPRYYGGTERTVSWLTEKLVSLGHEVTLFASGDSVTNARLIPVCQRALRLDAECVDPIAHHALLIEKVFKLSEEFDIIHFHTDYLHFLRSRRERAHCITTLHGRLDIPDLVPLYREFAEMPLVSVSNAQRRPLPWVNWLATVHHGMPPESLQLHTSPGQYLAFLGRISPEKGVDRAVEIAIRSGMKIRIAAKVDRADQDYFKSRIRPLLSHPLVEFIGEIGNSEKNDFLGNAAALLFPIAWPEPFGLVMIEAMACGTPVVAYANGSVPEIVADGINGRIVNNIEAAVSAVRNIGAINRRKCREHFETNFTDDRMAAGYLTVYRKLIEPKTPLIAVEEEVLNWIEVESQAPSTT